MQYSGNSKRLYYRSWEGGSRSTPVGATSKVELGWRYVQLLRIPHDYAPKVVANAE